MNRRRLIDDNSSRRVLALKSNGFQQKAHAYARRGARVCAETSAHARKPMRMRESVRSRARASAHARKQI